MSSVGPCVMNAVGFDQIKIFELGGTDVDRGEINAKY